MNCEVVGMRECSEREVRLVEEPAVDMIFMPSLSLLFSTCVFKFAGGSDNPLQL